MSNDHGESDVAPTESETTRTVGNFPHGSRETPGTSASSEADRSEKARCHNADAHVLGESDSSIVPKKPANNDSATLSAELVEGRGLTKENTAQLLPGRTQRRTPGLCGLHGVRAGTRRELSSRNAVCTSVSEVRAVCGNSARTDLCGGWPARAIPTAIPYSVAQGSDRRQNMDLSLLRPPFRPR